MIKKLTFNKIDENYVSEYLLKIIDTTTNTLVYSKSIANKNNGPTIHTKKLEYQPNNVYFVDSHIYYTDFYEISVYIDNKLINNINIEYNSKTKCFFLNNVNNININSNIFVHYYKNIIEHNIDIKQNEKVVITPIFYTKHYVGNHNVLY